MKAWYTFVLTYQGTFLHAFQLHHLPNGPSCINLPIQRAMLVVQYFLLPGLTRYNEKPSSPLANLRLRNCFDGLYY